MGSGRKWDISKAACPSVDSHGSRTGTGGDSLPSGENNRCFESTICNRHNILHLSSDPLNIPPLIPLIPQEARKQISLCQSPLCQGPCRPCNPSIFTSYLPCFPSHSSSCSRTWERYPSAPTSRLADRRIPSPVLGTAKHSQQSANWRSWVW